MILSLETSANICSVALHDKGVLCCTLEMHMPRAHAAALGLLVQQAMALCQVRKADAIAIAKGPGSYTGLRLGASTAKGLCYGWDVPLIGVDTLLGMAALAQEQLPLNKALLCPMIDARRMEVYRAVYNPLLQEILPVEAHILSENSLDGFEETLYFGDGAPKAQALLSAPHRYIHLLPSAKGIGIVAQQLFAEEKFEDLAYFEPFYLKEFMAKEAKGHKLLRGEA